MEQLYLLLTGWFLNYRGPDLFQNTVWSADLVCRVRLYKQSNKVPDPG
ncbi:hypothetical protein SAMN04487894_112126 [Niabella drilacis]|uniref:Uncharacterized protein n=1 Tax=Niabella drilacis (strain DSM 25811 / CCM 8410 / CCUG 62505 / LMG 26954 / E90) TaxID=1285928 RepID=A0A1G6X6D5_NIADE|nr:hypothetical protein SAMN04487894_112126 [Niabella drilacis]